MDTENLVASGTGGATTGVTVTAAAGRICIGTVIGVVGEVETIAHVVAIMVNVRRGIGGTVAGEAGESVGATSPETAAADGGIQGNGAVYLPEAMISKVELVLHLRAATIPAPLSPPLRLDSGTGSGWEAVR